MRALTITQPWAGLIAANLKLVENRPRRMIKPEDFGKPFAIHASREAPDREVYERIEEIAPDIACLDNVGGWTAVGRRWYPLTRITSAVIAVATIEGYVTDETGDIKGQLRDVPDGQRRWFFGPIGYVLRDVRALATPVPCKGMLGFWTLPADVAARVEEQLA